MADELLEFVLAVDEYKRANSRPFPTWSEVFELIQFLGYRKVADRGEHINRVQLERSPAADATPPAEDD